MSMYDDVGAFHAKFNLPNVQYHVVPAVDADGTRKHYLTMPHQLSETDFRYRMQFIQEELQEFVDSHHAGDLVGMADALADLAWVVLGTAQFMHLPFDEVWAEVRRANMDKTLAVEEDNEHKRGCVERIRKPAGWRPPQLRDVLVAAGGEQ